MSEPLRFITFEGPEGSGKSTQARRLAEWLESRSATVRLTYEPGDTELGRELRRWLLHRQEPMSAAAEFLLYSADRAEHVNNVIAPTLASGGFVISDRFVDSSYAYQGYGRGLDLDWLRQVSAGVIGGYMPALTILLDLPPEVGLARFEGRDRLEGESLAFHVRVRKGYLELAAAEPERFVVINAELPAEAVFARIVAAVRERWRL